ncbi:hypothetical protein M8J76_009791 [Diaphorina citri]|nr:hypothetical protein M8J75_015506 [Diaphorina citri]KAI5741038.1 hypothetical protein M8J76_009791 [Diaphorina citri]
MADLYSKSDMENLLEGKHVLILGDSNMRALYKDLVWLICKGTLITHESLRAKGEYSFLGDTRVKFDSLTRARNYVEHRIFYHPPSQTKLEFRFITQVLSDATQKMLEVYSRVPREAPSVVLINSTVWDVNRWGPNGDIKFQSNIRKLMLLFQCNLPCDTAVVWVTALHPAAKIQGRALVVKQLEFIQNSLQFQILEANYYAASVAKEFGFDVLDFHYYTRLLAHRRCPDGIHYTRALVRYLTEIWEVKLPGKVKCRDIDYVLQCKADQKVQNTENEDKANTAEVEGRKVLRARRKARQTTDSDTCKSPSELKELVVQCAKDLLRGIQQKSDDMTVEQYFPILTEPPSPTAPEPRSGFTLTPSLAPGPDPSSAPFHEDDVFWDRPPPANQCRIPLTGQSNVNLARIWNQPNAVLPNTVWEQPSPFMFNQNQNLPFGAGNPFQSNICGPTGPSVFQFNAKGNRNDKKRKNGNGWTEFPGNNMAGIRNSFVSGQYNGFAEQMRTNVMELAQQVSQNIAAQMGGPFGPSRWPRQ